MGSGSRFDIRFKQMTSWHFKSAVGSRVALRFWQVDMGKKLIPDSGKYSCWFQIELLEQHRLGILAGDFHINPSPMQQDLPISMTLAAREKLGGWETFYFDIISYFTLKWDKWNCATFLSLRRVVSRTVLQTFLLVLLSVIFDITFADSYKIKVPEKTHFLFSRTKLSLRRRGTSLINYISVRTL